MRNALYLLVLSMFLLAACGGGGDNNDDGGGGDESSNIPADDLIATFEAERDEVVDDNDTPPDTDDTEPTAEPRMTTDPNAVTTFSTVDPNDPGEEFVIPPVGILGEASTEDPQPDTPIDAEDLRTDFDYIYYEQTLLNNDGTRTSLVLEVYGDGRVVIDRDESNSHFVTQAELTAVADIINEVDFFYMQNTFLSGVPQVEGAYRYRMAVIRGTLERVIQADDGYMPAEIRRLLGSVRSLADQIPNPFPEAVSPTEEGS